MKRILLAASVLFGINANAQIEDTVSLMPGYMDQVWYSLENDEQAREPKNNWDIAFDVSQFGASILVNQINGVSLYAHPSDTSDFTTTTDTTGMSTWIPLNNSDTTWSLGAFNENSMALDMGWGTYNTLTHQVVGNKFFIIELANGDLQKIWIESLASGVYTFRHATLDNSMDMTHTLTKSDFADKNFGYFNLSTHSELDREPNNQDWDLQFTQYHTLIPTGPGSFLPYTVSGVLSNAGVEVAEANGVDQATYIDYMAETFDSKIDVIGYDWKSYQGSWMLVSDRIFFVKTASGDIWKLVFTDFGGMGNGNYVFSKELLAANNIKDNEVATLEILPNPASENTTLILDGKGNDVNITVTDFNGKTVLTQNLNNIGFVEHHISIEDLSIGMYFVTVITNGTSNTKKLIKK